MTPEKTKETLDKRKTVEYVMQYGGRCRDCADEDGVCPATRLPCDTSDKRKAVERVVDAINYGLENGFLKSSLTAQAATQPADAQKRSDSTDACLYCGASSIINSRCTRCNATTESALQSPDVPREVQKALSTYFPFDHLEHEEQQSIFEFMEQNGLAVMLDTEKGSAEEYEYGQYVWRLTSKALALLGGKEG